MQAFCCDVVRAFTKLGIAMAAKRPIMATTIMISTKVKPALRDALIFILQFVTFCFLRGERYNRRVTIIALFVHTLPVVPVGWGVAGSMPQLRPKSDKPPSWKQKARSFRFGLESIKYPCYGSLCVGTLQVGPFVTLAPGE